MSEGVLPSANRYFAMSEGLLYDGRKSVFHTLTFWQLMSLSSMELNNQIHYTLQCNAKYSDPNDLVIFQ